MQVSAVVVTYNSSGVLEACWRSLRSVIPDVEIIVVDNASIDDTREVCGRLDGVRLIANEVNVGYGRACNQGATAASGSHVLILNPDVEIIAFDQRALAGEGPDRAFGLAAPVLDHGPSGGSTTQPWVVGLLGHVIGPLRPRELPNLPIARARRRTWWPAGALLLVSREEFTRLGGFDERFFLFYEDTDLARRYRAAGFPVRATELVRATHLHGKSSTGDGSGVPLRRGWSYLSWIEYLYTWHGRDTAVRAARSARALGAGVDRTLAVLERGGPLAARAERKRRELAELAGFIRWQSSFAEGTAAEDFCPSARAIEAAL